MSKDKESKGKIRVFMFEVEATNETLLESVRGLTGAMNRAFGPARVVVQQALAPGANGPVEYEADGDVEQADYEVDDSSTSSDTSRSRKRARPRTPQVLDDVDFKGASVPLTEFVQHKSPSDDSKRFLVIAAWFKEYGGVDAITPDHIYTGYRWMRWSPPKDMGQPLTG